jgi:hypothetical protein
MGKKRGLSQIDWVISLAFFVIFLTFFFVFLSSRINMPAKSDSLIMDLESAFLDDIQWIVEKTPVFSDARGPIVVDFPLNRSLNYYFEGKCFSIDDDRFFYVASANVHYLLGSNESYQDCTESLNLSHSHDYASTSDAFFGFDDCLLEQTSYKGNVRISDLSYPGSVSNCTHSGNEVIAKYDAFSTSLHHKSYVIANGSELIVFIEPDFVGPLFDFSFDAVIDSYDNWYVYNGSPHSGDDSPGCRSFTNVTFLDFYDSDGLAFVFDNADIEFCFDGNISLDVELNNFKETMYRIIFHDNDYTNVSDLSESFFGMTKEIRGISESKLESLSNVSYVDLKQRYDYPLEKDFGFEIYQNDFLIFEYDKSVKAPSGDVFVHGKKSNILDKFGNQTGVEVFTKVW